MIVSYHIYLNEDSDWKCTVYILFVLCFIKTGSLKWYSHMSTDMDAGKHVGACMRVCFVHTHCILAFLHSVFTHHR
jgi:hypothetical protein